MAEAGAGTRISSDRPRFDACTPGGTRKTGEHSAETVEAQPWIGYSDPGHWGKTETPDSRVSLGLVKGIVGLRYDRPRAAGIDKRESSPNDWVPYPVVQSSPQ